MFVCKLVKFKILFLLILLNFINFSVFTLEKIIDLKYQKYDDFKRFYLTDEAGNKNYGFFEFDNIDPENQISVKDTTSDQYSRLANLTFVNNLFEYRRQKMINIISMSATYGLFAATTGLGASLLTLGLTSETIDETSTAMQIAGGALLIFSGFELIVGSIFLGKLIYFMVMYNRTKKDILMQLNKTDTSLIKLKNINIRFVVDLT